LGSTLLFGLLGSDQTSRLLKTGNSEATLDTLSDVRDVLYAFYAYTAGLRAAFVQYAIEMVEAGVAVGGFDKSQLQIDKEILGSTLSGIFSARPKNLKDFSDAVETFYRTVMQNTGSSNLLPSFSLIGDVGPQQFLDMIMGAASGKPLLGTTTEINFESTAYTFFSNISAQDQQRLKAELLPRNASDIVVKAKTDVNVRSALMALSAVSIEVSPTVASKLTLLDKKTGVGEISESWINDRADMLTYLLKKYETGVTGVLSNLFDWDGARYFDQATKTEVMVGTLAVNRKQYIFGSDKNDTIVGEDLDDHLYGGQGADTVSGGRGDDRIEGNSGNDVLSGDDGNDYIEGNDGNDDLSGGVGRDTLVGGKGHDRYYIRDNEGLDLIIDSDGDGEISLGGINLATLDYGYSNGSTKNSWSQKRSAQTAAYQYSLDAATKTLTIKYMSTAVLVENFHDGDFGIHAPSSDVIIQNKENVLLEKQSWEFDAENYKSADWGNPDGLGAGYLEFLTQNNKDGYLSYHIVNDFATGSAPDANSLLGNWKRQMYYGDDIFEGGLTINDDSKRNMQYWGYELQAYGNAGDDQLYATRSLSLQSALTMLDDSSAQSASETFLSGSVGNDTVMGAAGDDFLLGGDGDDLIVGGAGNDLIYADQDLVYRGAGRARVASEIGTLSSYKYYSGSNKIDGGVVKFLIPKVALYGLRIPFIYDANGSLQNAGGSLLFAPSQGYQGGYFYGKDSPIPRFSGVVPGNILGRGSDTIYAGAGDDCVEGGLGSDFIYGGEGGDAVFGCEGADIVYGEAGDDLIFGDMPPYVDPSSSYLYNAGSLMDAGPFVGAGFDFSLEGGDVLDGGAGNDYIDGGGGDDVIVGGVGDDTLIGDLGSDVFVYQLGDGVDSIKNALDVNKNKDRLAFLSRSGYDVAFLDAYSKDTILLGDAIKPSDVRVVSKRYLAAFESPSQVEVFDFVLMFPDGGSINVSNGAVSTVFFSSVGEQWRLKDLINKSGVNTGTDGNDTINGTDQPDTLVGEDGSDVLNGGLGGDMLEGGFGDDLVVGGGGHDFIKYKLGDGKDIIRGEGLLAVKPPPGVFWYTDVPSYYVGESDVLSLQGVDPGSVTVALNKRRPYKPQYGVSAEAYDFNLSFADGGSIALDNSAVALIAFEGRDLVWSLVDLVVKSGMNNGTEDADYLEGTYFNDLMMGNGGDDQINGGEGDDTIDGGIGNDRVDGGEGDDTYIFKRGGGSDTAYDTGRNSFDVIKVVGVRPEDVAMDWVAGVQIKGTADSIKFSINPRLNESNDLSLEAIVFDDGTRWDRAEIVSRLNHLGEGDDEYHPTLDSFKIKSGAGNDLIFDSLGDDTIDAGSGDDTVQSAAGADIITGGKGNDLIHSHHGDVIRYGWGDGNDTIFGSENFDLNADAKLVFGAGIRADDVEVWIDWSNGDWSYRAPGLLLINRGPAGGSVLIPHTVLAVSNGFNEVTTSQVAFGGVSFADGQTWSSTDLLAKVHGVLASYEKVPKFNTGFGFGSDISRDYFKLKGAEYRSVIAAGSGLTLLYAPNGFDQVLEFSSAAKRSDFSIGRIDGDLLIKQLNTGDQVRIFGWFGQAGDLGGYSRLPGTSYHLSLVTPGGEILSASELDFLANSALADQKPIGNHAPPAVLYAAQGSVFSHSFAADTITDPDKGDVVAYRVGLSVGGMPSSLPSWLSWDEKTRTLSGIPPVLQSASTQTVQIYLTGSSSSGGLAYPVSLSILGSSTKAPLLKAPLPDVTIASPGSLWSMNLTAAGFSDPEGAALAYSVTTSDGAALAGSWLQFDSATKTLKGTPTAPGLFSVRVTATDPSKLFVSDVFDIKVQNQGLLSNGSANGDSLSGTARDDTLKGLAGSDTLAGGAGADRLEGGSQDDTYVVDDAMATVFENVNEGADTVRASVDFTLPQFVEVLDQRSASKKVNGTGNDDANTLWSSNLGGTLRAMGGNDSLISGSGSDNLVGGLGDDTYVVNSNADEVVEFDSEGYDLVQSSVTYRLRDNVEELVLTGVDNIDGYAADVGAKLAGNMGNNKLYGGRNGDTLNGGAGNDLLSGGEGADAYLFAIGSGSDTVRDTDANSNAIDVISLDFIAATLTGIERRGNNLVLSYGSSDTLTVTDQFAGDATKIEQIKFNDGTVWDEMGIKSRVITNGDSLGNNIVGFTDVPNQINGFAGNDSITGSNFSDTIDGGAGEDTMVGGDGWDVYVVDSKNDVVIDTSGNDTVRSFVDYVLPFGVSYLDLMGGSDLNGWCNNDGSGAIMGNDGNNHLYGGTECDILDGGNDGFDTLEGGDGDDIYVVNSPDQVILEGGGPASGHDTMEVISVSVVTMAENVEDAIAYSKHFAVRVVGNKLANVLTGANNGADDLKGAAGNDTLKGLGKSDVLNGGTGDDLLLGGTGSDKYYFARGDGKDTVVETQAARSLDPSNDSIIYTGAVATTDLWLSRQGNDLQLDLLGGNDQIKVTNWFKASSYQVENISLLGAGKSLNLAGINQLVSAMAQFAPPTSGLSSLSSTQRSQVESAIAANWR
jgi:Ca2+-binding RTX toxin-like protein